MMRPLKQRETTYPEVMTLVSARAEIQTDSRTWQLPYSACPQGIVVLLCTYIWRESLIHPLFQISNHEII